MSATQSYCKSSNINEFYLLKKRKKKKMIPKSILIFISATMAATSSIIPVTKESLVVEFRKDYTHDRFYTLLNEQNIQYTSQWNYTFPSNGTAIEVEKSKYEYAIEFIKSLYDVKDIWSSSRLVNYFGKNLDLDPTSHSFLQPDYLLYTLRKKDHSHSQAYNSQKNGHYLTTREYSKGPWDIVHEQTHVKEIHQRGITGKNIVIAILDTGIDSNHEAIGTEKVIGGYGFTSIRGSTESDFHDYDSHGTGVAGIAAGKSKMFLGVAPDAKLLSYRIVQENGIIDDKIILSALKKAYEDGADIIGLTVNNPSGFADSPVSAYILELSKKGIIIITNAGETTWMGSFNSLSGGGDTGSLAVGSFEALYRATWPMTAQNSDRQVENLEFMTTNGTNFELNGSYVADYSTLDACKLKTRPGKNKILILPRGTCPEQDKLNNLDKFGYQYVFLMNSASDQFVNVNKKIANYSGLKNIRGMAYIHYKYAHFFNSSNPAQYNLNFSSSDSPIPVTNEYKGAGLANTWTSWGLTNDNHFYPSICAPGGNVFAPALNNKYLTVEGTGFAAGYVCGVAALYLESKAVSRSLGTSYSSISREFNSKVVDTSKTYGTYPLLVTGDQLQEGTLLQQGAGLLNAVRLIDNEVEVLSSTYLNLNDTTYFQDVHKITIANKGPKILSYIVKHQAGTAQYVTNGRDITEFPGSSFPNHKYSVKFNVSTGSIKAGETATVEAKFTPDSVYQPGIIDVGKIFFQFDNGQTLGIPYAGFSYNSSSLEIVNSLVTSIGTFLDKTSTSNLPFIQTDVDPIYKIGRDRFGVKFALWHGTKVLHFDLVSFDYQTNFSDDLNKSDKYFGPLGFYQMGEFSASPGRFLSRTDGDYLEAGKFANGTIIPAGKYKVLVRALKRFGDENKQNDYQVFLTNSFTLVN